MPKDRKRLLLRQDLCELLRENHIVALQETWYAKQQLEILNSIHKDFIGVGSATADESNKIYQGRYLGGVAILWRKELSKNIKRLDFNTDWGGGH